jgi:hypothetical protein
MANKVGKIGSVGGAILYICYTRKLKMDARQSGFLDSGNDFFLETNYLGL